LELKYLNQAVFQRSLVKHLPSCKQTASRHIINHGTSKHILISLKTTLHNPSATQHATVMDHILRFPASLIKPRRRQQ
jgi:hypothetical protein